MHASLVNAGVLEDPVTGTTAVATPLIATVVRSNARKLAHLRRTGHATVVFRHGYEWASVDGPARIVGPDDPLDGFGPEALPELLRAVFRAAGGTHDDWDEFDRVMAAERRTAVLVEPARIVSNG